MYEMGIEIQNLNVWYWKIPQLKQWMYGIGKKSKMECVV
jgi:hypothetical protein